MREQDKGSVYQWDIKMKKSGWYNSRKCSQVDNETRRKSVADGGARFKHYWHHGTRNHHGNMFNKLLKYHNSYITNHSSFVYYRERIQYFTSLKSITLIQQFRAISNNLPFITTTKFSTSTFILPFINIQYFFTKHLWVILKKNY